MPNGLAYLALLLWPLACLALFRRTSVERALIWSLLGGYLLLPPVANFNLPLLPSFDKTIIPSLSAAFILAAVLGRKLALLPQNRLARLLVAIFVLSAIPTVLTNMEPTVFTVLPGSEPIIFKAWELPGLSIRDVISVLGNQILALLPFLLARQFLATETGMREILIALLIAGLVYSVPSLIEIRLSPQINVWVYGFFQHEFAQTIRQDGFRPIVFLPHSLWLAFFVMSTVLAAAALARGADAAQRPRLVLAMLYLIALLYLSKSLASLAYGLSMAPLVFFAGTRVQIGVAVAFALIATIYPLLRGGGYVPVDELLGWASAISPERAASLAYRFDNETLLLERAAEKPWFGWGGWSRNLLLDSESGEILTIPDGRWIIAFGTYGWLGYVSEFGLLSLPILLLGVESFRLREGGLSRPVAAIALILAINMIDMLLNATLTPITWMLAGAVLGHAELRRAARRADDAGAALRINPVIGGLAAPSGPRTRL